MNTPKQIAESYIEIGAAKAAQGKWKTFLLAVLAGVFVALAGVGSTVGSSLGGKIASACIFPAGLAMVIVAGSELFTGNSLMVISLMERRITLGQLLTVWLIVYLGNFVGALFVTALAVWGGTFDALYEPVIATAAAKTAIGFGDAFLRGVLCNIMVCTAVWMTMAAKDAASKIICLYLPIMVFVLGGFEHCIANMYYIPAGLWAAGRYGVTAEGLSWGTMAVKNLLPVTLGNVAGGVGLGVVFHAIYLPARARQKV